MKHTILASFAALVVAAEAGTNVPALPATPALPAPASTGDGWSFRLAPYAWLTAIEGDVGFGRVTAPIDISFGDTLDTLDMAFMGGAELRRGRWGLGMDVIYGKTSSDTEARGWLFKSFRYEQTQWLLTPTLSFRAIQTENYYMDLTAGARISILDAELTGRFDRGGQTSFGRDTDWVDPVVGLRGQAELGNGWFFRYSGDIGGFGVSSDLTWQAFAGIGYHFNQCASVAVGYRGLGVDYSKDRFSLDTVTHGPVIGVEFRF